VGAVLPICATVVVKRAQGACRDLSKFQNSICLIIPAERSFAFRLFLRKNVGEALSFNFQADAFAQFGQHGSWDENPPGVNGIQESRRVKKGKPRYGDVNISVQPKR
jgi:hypothetical protein